MGRRLSWQVTKFGYLFPSISHVVYDGDWRFDEITWTHNDSIGQKHFWTKQSSVPGSLLSQPFNPWLSEDSEAFFVPTCPPPSCMNEMPKSQNLCCLASSAHYIHILYMIQSFHSVILHIIPSDMEFRTPHQTQFQDFSHFPHDMISWYFL